jgi:hypothetical protein
MEETDIEISMPEIVFYALFMKYCLAYIKKELVE